MIIISPLLFRPVQWCTEVMCQGRNTAARLSMLCAAAIWREAPITIKKLETHKYHKIKHLFGTRTLVRALRL